MSAFFELALQWEESENERNKYVDAILLLEKRKSQNKCLGSVKWKKMPEILKCATQVCADATEKLFLLHCMP